MSKSGCSCELNSKEPRQVVFLLRKVLYITNYPSPYRVDFFNLLGKAVDLTVSYTSRPEAQKHRSADWFHTNYDAFTAVFLKEKRGKVFVDIIPLIREGWDHIIIGGYSLPTFMLAIEYMRLHRIPFAIEADDRFDFDELKTLDVELPPKKRRSYPPAEVAIFFV